MKWVLSLLTLAALFAVGMLAPKQQEEPRASSVAVTTLSPEPADAPTGESLAMSAASVFEQAIPERVTERERYKSPISDTEAIDIAMRRGDEIAAARAAGDTPTLRREDAEVVAAPVVAPEATPEPEPAVAATETAAPEPETTPDPATETAAAEAPSQSAAETWLVTGSRVNLRGGPSTDNPVVGSVTEGEALIPVSGLGSDWVEVETPSGQTAWIAAQFITRSEG